MDNSKRLTLEALVAKAEQRRQEKFETHQVEVPSLGGALQLEKIPPDPDRQHDGRSGGHLHGGQPGL